MRTVAEWNKILGDIPVPDGVNSEALMAGRILADLIGYRKNVNDKDRAKDIREVANAMIAYAQMHFDAGVRP